MRPFFGTQQRQSSGQPSERKLSQRCVVPIVLAAVFFALSPMLLLPGTDALGQTAAMQLLRRLEANEAGPPQDIELPIELIVRASTGPAPFTA